jgi:hypothetical protein
MFADKNTEGRGKLTFSARKKSALICEKEKDGFTQMFAD